MAVVQGGQITWEESFGWADQENRMQATPHTPYTLASLSKPISVTAVMLLRERGLLDVDAPLNNYLGDTKIRSRLGPTSGVTIRRLAQHISGLPNHYETFYPDEEEVPPTIDWIISHYGYTMMPQGRFHYSNLGYRLLGHVISQVSGQTFADFVQKEVFRPLGMLDSFVQESTEIENHHAIRYRADGTRVPDYITPHAPASDIYASVHDLALFALFHLNRRQPDQAALLSAETISEMQEQTVPIDLWDYDYGLVWSVGTDMKGRKHIFHGGGGVGVDAHMALIPEEQIAVAVLTNGGRGENGVLVADDILRNTLAVVLGDQVENVQIDYTMQDAQTSGLPGVLLGEWRGTVHTLKQDIPAQLWVKENGEVHAQLGDQFKMLLNHNFYREGIFLGRMMGDIGTEEANRRRYHLFWDLRFIDTKLSGALHTIGHGETRGLSLPYWVQFERVSAAE